jgi:peptidyl-tRNA hydrolase
LENTTPNAVDYWRLKIEELNVELSAASIKLAAHNEYFFSGQRKIVLKADAKEWFKIKQEYPDVIEVKDAGLTQLPAGSATVLGLWPMKKSSVSKTLKRLQVLT